MNISGVLLRARPERFEAVCRDLGAIAGVQVHLAEPQGGRIVVTVEDGPTHSVEASLLAVHLIDGLVDGTLIYQYSDDGDPGTSSSLLTQRCYTEGETA